MNIALIIDDDKNICSLLTVLLEHIQYTTYSVQTLYMTGSIVEDISPTVIFVDNGLPDGLGFDYIPVLRKNFPEAKIIAMTAEVSPEDRLKAMTNGAEHFLTKPFSLDELFYSLNK